MVHYGDYLQLEKLLAAQHPESDKLGQPAHDEMLFIVIHQAYELWFKQLLYETGSVIDIMQQPALNDNSPELQTVVHRMSRCTTILKVLVHQIDIMETMTPMDFLDFRDMLRPASGFQSVQFKLLEARLGLPYQARAGQQYYLSQLRPSEADRIREVESAPSLLQLVNKWLERMPFMRMDASAGLADEVADGVTSSEAAGLFEGAGVTIGDEGLAGNLQTEGAAFWADYRARYQASLAESEKGNLEGFEKTFFGDAASDPIGAGSEGRALSPAACRSALFIMLYRGYPMLQLPFQVLNQLLEVDEQLSTWRFRHMNMVHRIIGMRVGTGGSTGKDYLGAALSKHYVFKEVAGLTSYLIERRHLPHLDAEVEKQLGFAR